MNHYKKIPIWENKRRLHLLVRFRALVVSYFKHTEKKWLETELIEDKQARVFRMRINRLMEDAHVTVKLADLNPSTAYKLAPAAGGYVTNIDFIQDIFRIHRFQVSPTNTLDLIDRAIGIYQRDRLCALLRSVNPLFWLGLVVDYLIRFPFLVLSRLGLDPAKTEASVIGKIVKGCLSVIVASALILTVLEILGYGDWLRALSQRLIQAYLTADTPVSS